MLFHYNNEVTIIVNDSIVFKDKDFELYKNFIKGMTDI